MTTDERFLQSELLVIRCQRGDRSAFASIVEMWERPLFYYLRRLVASEADAWDLLQDTWLKLYRSIGSLREPRSLRAFLYTTARNAAMSRLRREQLDENLSGASGEDLESPADDIAEFDNAEMIHHALDQLPLPQREVLTLYFLQDLSLDEITALLEVPLGTVKSRLHYGKLALRKILLQGDNHGE